MAGSPASAPGPSVVRPGLVFAGLTIATGPGFARFRIGTMILAHPELNVPTTPMTLLLPAYARPFEAHFAESQAPACAVESPPDWKPSFRSPTLKARCLRASVFDWTISVVWA